MHASLLATAVLLTSPMAPAAWDKPMMSSAAYEKAGRIQKIAQVAEWYVDSVLKDDTLLANPRFKETAMEIPAPLWKFHLSGYLASVLGGPQKYMGPDLGALRRYVNFTPDQEMRDMEQMKMAFDKAGWDMPSQEMVMKDLAKRKAMGRGMKKPMLMESLKDKKSLYGRLGGILPISLVVEDFANLLVQDPTITSNPNTMMAFTSGRATGAGIKYLLIEQLAAASGGPYTYTGRSMKDSHRGLMISEKEWEVTAGLLKQVLDKYQVPAKEQGEIFSVIGGTKKDIVGG